MQCLGEADRGLILDPVHTEHDAIPPDLDDLDFDGADEGPLSDLAGEGEHRRAVPRGKRRRVRPVAAWGGVRGVVGLDDHPATLYKGRMSEVVYSPLSRSVEHKGREFQIEIYQADRPSSWLLEILDEEGASTVWDDVFEDDQEALEEAIKAIEEGLDGQGAERSLVELVLTEALIALERQEVLDALATTKFEALGVLAAVVTAPQLVQPREWLGLLLREEFSDEAALSTALAAIMNVYNGMVRCLDEGSLPIHGFQTFEELGEWAAGYVEVAMGDEVWASDDEALDEMSVLVSFAGLPQLEPAVLRDRVEKLAELMTVEEASGMAMRLAVLLHGYWAPARRAGAEETSTTFRRSEPKVGRNQPCPCGSGKKYKRCCGRN